MQSETYVIEWSKKLNAFRTSRQQNCLDRNLSAFHGNQPRDYMPIMIGTKDQCDRVANNTRHKLQNRENRPSSRQGFRSDLRRY